MLNNHNDLVKKAINTYIDAGAAPRFAVMVTGGWGSGKTEFIRRVIQERKSEKANLYEGSNEKTYVYVSVYGCENIDVIDQAIFMETHPFRSSKAGRFASKIAKGMLKGALKVDLDDGEGKTAGTINIDLSTLSSSDFSSEESNIVLIVDDLERSKIDPDVMFGYLNGFVEHLGCKVIIIANEDEISKASSPTEDSTRYRNIKEKLVGQTYAICPEVKTAFDAFANDIKDDDARAFIIKHIDLLIESQRNCNIYNLRHARQGLYLLSRLFKDVEQRHWEHEALTKQFLNEFMAINIGVRQGIIYPSDLEGITYAKLRANVREKAEREVDPKITRAIKFLEITDLGEMPHLLLGHEMWESIFRDGVWCPKELNRMLNESHYYPDSPAWHKLWNMYESSDEDIATYYCEVKSTLDARKFPSIGDFLLSVSCILRLAEFRVFNLETADVVDMAKSYLDDVSANEKILDLAVNDIYRHSTGYKGMGYHCAESEHFKEILSYYIYLHRKAIAEGQQAHADALFAALSDAPADFVAAIDWNDNSPLGDFSRRPFLHLLDPDKFLEALFSIKDISMQRVICHSLISRFRDVGNDGVLDAEVSWLEAFGDTLIKNREKNPGSFHAQTFADVGEGLKRRAEELKAELETKTAKADEP